jgi:hypothetical protein
MNVFIDEQTRAHLSIGSVAYKTVSNVCGAMLTIKRESLDH